MNEHVLASFIGGDFSPVLVAPDQGDRVTACLRALSTMANIEEIATAELAQDDFWPHANDWRAGWRPYVVKAGVLQIPVKGLLLHNFPWAIGNYATGYYYIQKALERGLSDPEVTRIALVCDSPGGHVAGCFELVDRIFEARSKKPIAAFAHEHAYSAAYAVASGASQIAVSRTGGVGSIGVVTQHVDYSGMMENAGVKVTFIFAGKHKVDGNAYEPLSEDAKARIQARIDSLYDVFVQSVARNRKMSEKAVRGTEALTFSSAEAVDRGLADKVAPLDEALAEFATCQFGSDGEDEMTTITKEQHDKAVAEAADGARAEAVSAERARVAAIRALPEAEKRPSAAKACEEDGMSVEKAKAFLSKLPEEGAAAKETNTGESAFQKRMAEESQSQAGAGSGSENRSEAEKAQATSNRILEARFGKKSA